MNDPQSPLTALWHGWLRDSGRWRHVCQDDDMGKCWSKLLAVRSGAHSDRLVLRDGESPVGRMPRQGRLF